MKKKSIILSGLKKILFSISVFSLYICMTSCQDWLDMPSYTDPDSETVFLNEDMAELFVLGCIVDWFIRKCIIIWVWVRP